LSIYPDHSFTLYNLGILYHRQGKQEQAQALFTRVLSIAPNSWLAQRMLARCLEDAGRGDEAQRILERAIAAKPGEAGGYEAFAEFLGRRGQHAAAMGYYRHALALDTPHPDTPKKLAETLERTEGAAARIRFLEGFVARYPHRADVANHLGWVLATHPDHAARNGRRAVEIALRLRGLDRHENRFVLDTLAAGYAETGRFREASQTAEAALRLAQAENDPVHSEALRGRLALYQSGRPFRELCDETPSPVSFKPDLAALNSQCENAP
jgi:tetratricopeptide (TPR) repeat protein